MAEDWPDWLPTQNLQAQGIVYVIQQHTDGSFTIATADPEGQDIFGMPDRDQLINWLLKSYPGPPTPDVTKRGLRKTE